MLLLRRLDKGILQVPLQPPLLSSSFPQKLHRGVQASAHPMPTTARKIEASQPVSTQPLCVSKVSIVVHSRHYRQPSEGVESPCWETFEIKLDIFLCHLLGRVILATWFPEIPSNPNHSIILNSPQI